MTKQLARVRRTVRHGARRTARAWHVASRPLRRAAKRGRRTLQRWRKPVVGLRRRLAWGRRRLLRPYDKRLRRADKRFRRRLGSLRGGATRRAGRVRKRWLAAGRRIASRSVRRWWLVVHAVLGWLIAVSETVDAALVRWALPQRLDAVFRYAPFTQTWAGWLRRRARPIPAGYVGGSRYQGDVRGIHLKERQRPYEHSFKDAWGYLRYRLTDREGQLKKRAMWLRYTQHARVLPLDVPFVYVALHLQPERTTSSLGGVFADQFALIDMLARSLPRGWKVYVKEHPSQFYPPFCGERGRHPDFYRDVRCIPNVELASLSMSTFDLIDCARAVATVTGTVGWEAVIRGTPALVFGSPWYRYCEGAIYVPTLALLTAALARIETGWRPDYRKVRLFMLALDRVCARAGLGYNTPDEHELGLTHEETVDRLSSLLERHWIHMQAQPVAARRSLDAPAGVAVQPVDAPDTALLLPN